MRTPGFGDSRFSSTSGVLPIASTMSPYRPPQGRLPTSSNTPKAYSPGGGARRGSAAGHGREDHDRVGVRDRRLQTLENAHVFVVQIDVDVAVQLAALAE